MNKIIVSVSQPPITVHVGAPAVLIQQFPHLTAKLSDRGTQSQGSTTVNSAASAGNYISQYTTDLQMPMQDIAAHCWQQKLSANPQPAIPLIVQ